MVVIALLALLPHVIPLALLVVLVAIPPVTRAASVTGVASSC
jgi:hypothetical protein